MLKTLLRTATIAVAVALIACALIDAHDPAWAMGPRLRVIDTSESEVEGTFTLILYGARHADDIETIAILDKEGDPYTFDVYAPDFDYRVMKSVPAKRAVQESLSFVSWHPMFRRAVTSRILDEKGTVVGFEVRPLYQPSRYGTSDVMDVYYFQRDKTIRVHVKLKPRIEREHSSGDVSKGGKGR